MTAEKLIKEAFKKTWDAFSNNFVVLILGTLVALLLMIFIVTIPPLIFGINYMCVKLINGRKIEVTDVFRGFRFFFRSWGIVILGILGIALGLVFLIIPGLLLMILWQYAFSIAIIEDKGVIASLKRSYNLAKKKFAFSTIFFILVAAIGSLGSITRIGLLITIPFTVLATCIATQMLRKGNKKPKKKK